MKHTRVVSLNARQAKPGVHLVDTTSRYKTMLVKGGPGCPGLSVKAHATVELYFCSVYPCLIILTVIFCTYVIYTCSSFM